MDANSRAEYIVRIREEERARIRREEVEPLREALRELLDLLTSHAPWCLANPGASRSRSLGASDACDCRREAARAALRAADGYCPDCGNPNDHRHPDPQEGGRCRDCCSICKAAAADERER